MRSYFLLFLIPVVLVSCSWGSPQTPDDTLSSTGKKISISYTEEIQKASSKIKDTPEFNDCLRPSVNMCLNQVGTQIARAQKSEEFCNEITDIGNREGCKFGVIMLKATESKDINLCNSLDGLNKVRCRASVIDDQAVEKKDINLCDTLFDGSPKNNTQGSQTLTNTMQIEECKIKVLQKRNNVLENDCTVFTQKNLKDMCLVIVKESTKRLPPQETTISSKSTIKKVK